MINAVDKEFAPAARRLASDEILCHNECGASVFAEFGKMAEYSAIMMDHFHAPRNAGALVDADIVGHGSQDGSGRAPRTEIYLKLAGAVVERAGFTTFGCGAAIASASVLTELVTGKLIDQCHGIGIAELLTALDGLPADKVFCAEIALNALQDAVRQWRERRS